MMRDALAALRNRLFSAGLILLAAVFLSCGSMLISFFAVQYLTRGSGEDAATDPFALHRARMLRTFSNELVGLCNRYAARVPEDGSSVTSVNRNWIERGFRPEIRYLAQRMDDTILGDSPEFAALKAATARCAAMARHPQDYGLRGRALTEVRHVADAIQVHVDHVTGGGNLSPPRRLPRFGVVVDGGL